MKYFLIIAIIFSACGKDNEEQEPFSISLEDAQTQNDFYLSKESEYTDDYGWVQDQCDSLFTTCLNIISGGTSDMFLARDPDGRWWRTVQRVCLENQLWNQEHEDEIESGTLFKKNPSSSSSISRDPILVCSLVWWETGDLNSIESMLDYSKSNGGRIGESDGSIEGKNRIKMSLTLKATLCEMRARLGGKDDKACRKIPQYWGPPEATGSAAHLQVWHMLIRGKMFGAINNYTLSWLKKHGKRQPENGFFRGVIAKFTDGNHQPALDMLKPKHFPSDRLPTSSDRCAGNLWQHRMEAKNVEPCPHKGEIHPAIDYRIVVKLAEGNL